MSVKKNNALTARGPLDHIYAESVAHALAGLSLPSCLGKLSETSSVVLIAVDYAAAIAGHKEGVRQRRLRQRCRI